MLHRGVATFTLDTGKCPKWLYEKMVKLGREMARVIVAEYGPDEFVKRIADPVWFQSLGTVLAFDWNASGLTTVLTAALKEAIRQEEQDLGIFICGGKGKTSRKTPEEIQLLGARASLDQKNINSLTYNSKMAAKVDSSLIQDGFQIYHHSFFFSRNGAWAVVQQGMNQENQTARRYHWFSDNAKDLIVEPHSAVVSDAKGNPLNLTAKDSEQTRVISTELVQGNYYSLMKDLQLLRKYSTPQSQTISLGNKNNQSTFLNLTDNEFTAHPVLLEDFSRSRYLQKILYQVSEVKPKNYEELVALPGVGPKTVRALALVGEVVYGAKPSYQDPARYSFAHGGKDCIPYPIDRPTYDQTIKTMQKLVQKMKVGYSEKNRIINRLS